MSTRPRRSGPEWAQPRRGKAEQAAATRAALVRVARRFFGARGYGAVPIDEIAGRVGLTVGALYHHFRDKRALFRAVYEDVEGDLAGRIRADIEARATSRTNAWQEVRAGAQAFLDACRDADVQRIVLLEAPSVLGWDASRDITSYGLGLIRRGLERAEEQGQLASQPIEPLAHLLRSAITEGAILLARSPDQASARVEIGEAIDRLIEGIRLAGPKVRRWKRPFRPG
jgi:AcrR family transcriptional regulator